MVRPHDTGAGFKDKETPALSTRSASLSSRTAWSGFEGSNGLQRQAGLRRRKGITVDRGEAAARPRANIADTFKDEGDELLQRCGPRHIARSRLALYSTADCGGTVLDHRDGRLDQRDRDYTTQTSSRSRTPRLLLGRVVQWGLEQQGVSQVSAAPSTIVVAKASPSIMTTRQPTSGDIGDAFKDRATLSGGVNLDGTGSITFTLYSTADCGGKVLDHRTVRSTGSARMGMAGGAGRVRDSRRRPLLPVHIVAMSNWDNQATLARCV